MLPMRSLVEQFSGDDAQETKDCILSLYASDGMIVPESMESRGDDSN